MKSLSKEVQQRTPEPSEEGRGLGCQAASFSGFALLIALQSRWGSSIIR